MTIFVTSLRKDSLSLFDASYRSMLFTDGGAADLHVFAKLAKIRPCIIVIVDDDGFTYAKISRYQMKLAVKAGAKRTAISTILIAKNVVRTFGEVEQTTAK